MTTDHVHLWVPQPEVCAVPGCGDTRHPMKTGQPCPDCGTDEDLVFRIPGTGFLRCASCGWTGVEPRGGDHDCVDHRMAVYGPPGQPGPTWRCAVCGSPL